ncbi:hypothetical protein EDB83DRAFT_2673620 [Lactarius deliciosus]|nr:hypothetical protein EDB83DRAFT_2673620 [Lactarius deliciosus]
MSIYCTGSQSVDDQPFKIFLSEPDSLEQVGQELSGPLSTVEELIIAWDVHRWHTETHIQTDQWRGFCYHVPQVKVVQVPIKAAIDVARSFLKDGEESVLGLLPSLERIEVHSRSPPHKPVCFILRYVLEGRSVVPVALGRRLISIKLPEDVLLEIFDIYRQFYEHQPRANYEKFWNSRDGWFKLAHVCLHWRRVVLLSPSRLHVHLLFTPGRPPAEPMLRWLPRLPILVDCSVEDSIAPWTEKEDKLAIDAIRHRSPVRGITFQNLCPCFARFLEALSHPFPGLESLEISSSYIHLRRVHGLLIGRDTFLPVKLLSGSAPSLRRLTLQDVVPECISPLLSSATGLVELALTINIPYGALPEASFIVDLQRMSYLRRLELKVISVVTPDNLNTILDPPPLPACTGALSTLTDLIFVGHDRYLQVLVGSLTAPSLQHLDIETCSANNTFVPHLCKFICDAECQFIAVRLDFSLYMLSFFAETCPKFGHTQPFRIIIPGSASLEEIGIMLSGPLSTVEEFVVECDATQRGDRIQWRGFFNHIRRVKMVQVPSPVALDVARSIQLGGQESALDFLPALEHVKVPLTYLSPIGSKDPIKDSIRDAFEPLVAARKQVGRPIRLSWPRGVRRRRV